MRFEYINQGKRHTDTSREYMLNLGMNSDAIESVLRQKEYENEQQWSAARKKRDELVAAADHTQAIDSPLSLEKQAQYKDYRQSLRDVPQMFTDPYDIAWPVKPE